MTTGNNVIDLAIRIAVGVLAFFVADWLLPKFFAALKFLPPDPILLIVAILIGLAAFLYWPTVVGKKI